MGLRRSGDLVVGRTYRSEVDENHLTVKVIRFSENHDFVFLEHISGGGSHHYSKFDGLIKGSTLPMYPAHWRDINEFKFGK